MKKKFISVVLSCIFSIGVSFSQTNCDICLENGQPPIEESFSSLVNCGENLTICVGRNYTFSTTAISGAIYGWSVIGNAQIVGPRDQSTVTVIASQTGSFQICLVKSVNGQPNCCVCKTVTVVPCAPQLPCPLKIVIDGTMSDIGTWDPTCYGCVWNRVKLNVVCADGDITTLNSWMAANNITGSVKWEITSGNFHFYTPLSPCYTDACGVRCDFRNNINHPAYLASAYLCQCPNMPFWSNMVAKATIQLQQGSTVYNSVLTQQIHFNEISNGCFQRADFSDFKAYPNPTKEKLTVEFSLARESRVSIILTDVNGAVVKTLVTDKLCQAGKYNNSFILDKTISTLHTLVVKLDGEIVKSEKIFIRQD